MPAPDPPPPDDAPPDDPPRKVSGWERAGRGDARWWIWRACVALAISSALTAVLLVVGAVWFVAAVVAPMGEAIADIVAEGLAEALAPLAEEMRAAKTLVETPAPPPVAGTAEQAAELGRSFAAAWAGGDPSAVAVLLDRASLLRGLIDAPTIDLLAAADPSQGESLPPALSRSRVGSDDGDPGVASPPAPPPGTRAVWWMASRFLDDPLSLPAAAGCVVRADGVTSVDGVPAAALIFTSPGADPAPCDDAPAVGPPTERTVLLVPGPDGRVAAVYLEETGEYLADAFRRVLREAWKDLPPPSPEGDSVPPDAAPGGGEM